MKKFAGYLKDLYENSPIAPRCKEDPIPPEFIKLAIIKKDRVTRAKADAFTKATLRGGSDEDRTQERASSFGGHLQAG